MHQSIRRSFRCLYPPVGVRLCLLCLACHLLALRHMVLSSHWRLIGTRNPSSPTVTRIITPSLLTVAPCGGGLLYESWRENRNHGPQNARTKIATSLVKGTATKIAKGIGIGPKRATTDMFQNGLMGILRDAETMKAIAPVMANTRDRMGRRVHPTAAKPSRDAKEAPVHHTTVKSHTLPRVDLCHLHPCSIQLLYRRCADCLLTSRTPALHTCPSIRVGAHFLPST